MNVTTRVQNGIELLNNYYVCRQDERWYLHVDLNRLNMASAVNCILGQLFGDFFVGVEILALKMNNPFEKSYVHGFSINHDYAVSCASWDMCQDCLMLQREWKEHLLKLRRFYFEGLI